jgi:hypothetical protein
MSARMSEEIWLEVMQQFVSEPRHSWWMIAASEEILPLLLVSKQWQVCPSGIVLTNNLSNTKLQRLAEPLLYRYLRIFSISFLRKLVKAFDTQQAHGKDCGRWVWAIYVGIENSVERTYGLTSIILRCLNLRRADCIYDANCALLSLLALPGPTLRTMNVYLDPQDHSSMGKIDGFKNLQYLYIMCCPGRVITHAHNTSASLSDVPPWTLPELQNLHLVPSDNGEHVDLQYLARWSFPKLESLTMDHFEESEAEIKHLAGFLDAHPHISCLSLEGLGEMLPLMSHVRCPELRLGLTQLGEVSRTMVQLMRPEVVRLNLSYIDYRADALWKFLDELCTQPKGVRHVHIGMHIDRDSYPRRNMDWIEQHRSRMEEYASVLQPIGVQLTQDTNPWQYENP